MPESTTPPPSPYLLDCDTGIDDSLALLYLLGSPRVNLVGVTTLFGNTAAAQAADNTLRLLALAGRSDIPVAIGAAHPLGGEYDGGVSHIHGHNGIGDIDLPESPATVVAESGPEMIVRLAHEYPGELHLIPIGPLTNLALALALDPELPSLIKHVTIMGGAAMAPGNQTPVAEANIRSDADAAAIVFAAAWPMTMVGLDITMTQIIEETDRHVLLSSAGPVAPLVGQMLEVYFGFYAGIFGRRCSVLHDPLAAAIAIGDVVPVLAPRVRVAIDATDGPGRGQTIADLRGRYNGYPDQAGAHVRVVLGIDEPFAPKLMASLLRSGVAPG